MEINVNLENDNEHFILTYSKFYNDKWVIRSSQIESQTKFPSNIFFNSWIIKPTKGETNLKITLEFIESPYENLLKEVNKYSIIISVVLFVLLNIYEYRKIFYKLPIRKFWR